MRPITELHQLLRALLFRDQEDRDLDEELAFHLEMQTQANIARGMAPDEARRQALLQLGGLAQVREATRDARGVRWLDDLAFSFDLYAQRYDREARAAFLEELRERVAAIPGVEAATVPAFVPLDGQAAIFSVHRVEERS